MVLLLMLIASGTVQCALQAGDSFVSSISALDHMSSEYDHYREPGVPYLIRNFGYSTDIVSEHLLYEMFINKTFSRRIFVPQDKSGNVDIVGTQILGKTSNGQTKILAEYYGILIENDKSRVTIMWDLVPTKSSSLSGKYYNVLKNEEKLSLLGNSMAKETFEHDSKHLRSKGVSVVGSSNVALQGWNRYTYTLQDNNQGRDISGNCSFKSKSKEIKIGDYLDLYYNERYSKIKCYIYNVEKVSKKEYEVQVVAPLYLLDGVDSYNHDLANVPMGWDIIDLETAKCIKNLSFFNEIRFKKQYYFIADKFNSQYLVYSPTFDAAAKAPSEDKKTIILVSKFRLN